MELTVKHFQDAGIAPSPQAKSTTRRPPLPDAWISAADLKTKVFPPLAWVIPDYLPQGVTLLAGRPKLGKSWLALDWAVAVARGGYTMSAETRAPEGDVLYAALEDTQRRLQNRMHKVLSLGQGWPERLHFMTEMPRSDDGGVEMIRRWLAQAERPKLVVIDVFAAVRPSRGREESGYDADYASVAPWKALADEFEVALVLVHHVRKMHAEDPLEMVSGTNGLTGACDAIIILNRDSQGVTLTGRGRDLQEFERAIQFDREGCRWSVLGEATDVRRSDERTLILRALEAAGEPMSPREIADVTDHSYDAVRRLLVKMATAGEVEKAKRGLYVTPGHNGHNVTTREAA